jgi:WD40 repeat protein
MVLALLSIASVSADEGTAGETRSKPIPVARLKHSSQVDFDREVLPILKSNCLACHNKTTAKAKLVLETPEDMIKGGDSGPVVAPNKSGASLLLKAASHQLEDTVMPPPGNKVQASDLAPEELGLIKLWIDQGAKGSASIVRPIEWQPLPEGLNPIYAVAVTPDGQFAACARANQIFLYHLPSNTLAERLTDPLLQKSGLYARPGVAHRDIVHSLAFSPDGSLLASGAYREAKLWRQPKNTAKLRLASVAHKSVTAVATSSDGRWLATGGDDGRVQVRNLADGKRVRHLPALKGAIHGLTFSPDGTALGSVSADKMLRICEIPTGRIVAQTRLDSEPNALVWLADDQLASGGADRLIHLWHFDAVGRSLAPIKELRGHEGTVTALDVVPSTHQIVSGSSDGSLRLWDVESGKMIREMKHGGPITAVAVRHDGKRVASAGTDKTVKLWDFADGKQIAELKGDRYAQEHAADCERALIFAKSEAEFRKAELKSAETNETAQVQRVKKAADTDESAEKGLVEKQRNFLEATETRAAAEKSLEALQVEPKRAAQSLADAEAAAKGAESEAKTAKDTPGQTRETIERLSAEAAAKSKAAAEAKTAFDKQSAASKEKESKANEHLKTATKAFADAEKELKKAEQAESTARIELQLASKAADEAGKDLTDARTGIRKAAAQQKQTETDLEAAKNAAAESEEPIRCLAFSPDNLTLATGGDDGLIHTWSADNGAAFEASRGHKNAVFAVAFASNGNLVSGGADRSAVVWDLKVGWKLERVVGTGDVNSPIVDRVNVVKFSPDGNLLATGGGEPTRGGEIMLWQAATGQLTRSFTNVHSDAVFGLDFSPDGKYLASGAADKFAKVIDLSTGKIVRQFEGHTHHVLGVSWERNERMLASAGADNVIKVWDFTKGERKKNIGGFDKEVTSISFVGYSDQALAASGDGKVRLVREDGSEVRSFSGDNDFVESAAATPDGKIVVAGGQDGVLRVWEGNNGKLIASFPPPGAMQ